MMKTTFVTMLALGTWPLISTAMPTKAELDKVSPVVADLMRPEQEALKAGKKSKSEVAAIALELVAKADGEAAKLLLTKGAYNLYVRDGDFDKAIATLKSFREIVPDMEPQYLANIIESSLRTISRKNGGQLYRLLDETRTIARYRGELKKLETQAKKTPSDKSLQLKLAEHYAVLNDWAKALDAFALSSDRKASDVARMEKTNAKTLRVAADFWWNYPDRKAPEFEKPFRQHAAKLYEQAIASGELVGLNKVQADRRIKEADALGEAAFEISTTKDGLYCVIDLSGGPNAKHYPVSYLNAVPKGGWTDEYKTRKLVLRRIDPGRFMMQGKYEVVLTKPFYIGLFEMTQMQFELITGNNPSHNNGDGRCPVEQVSYDMIRGAVRGAEWPLSNAVDNESLIGKLRNRVGLDFDLPTEAQWEFACRAGSKSEFFWGDEINNEYFWWKANSGGKTHVVGQTKPNAWGLFDMSGNVWERCLNWEDKDLSCVQRIDPIGPVSGVQRAMRGGCCFIDRKSCSSYSFRGNVPKHTSNYAGLRLAIQQEFAPPPMPKEDGLFANAKREMEETVAAQHEDKLYCVIDLSGGPNAKRYPVSYLNSAPKTGWSDEYKTAKLILRKIKPGRFVMGDQVHGDKEFPPTKATITKAYYIGVFEVTQRQWELVMGTKPSAFSNPKFYAMRPVERISYDSIRGADEKRTWPQTDYVRSDSFIGLLQAKTKIAIDLPTETQWEYACRAGTNTDFGTGKNWTNEVKDLQMDVVGRYQCNGGWNEKWGPHTRKTWGQFTDVMCDSGNATATVGSYCPNFWGLYDMHGNVGEWCLDWHGRIPDGAADWKGVAAGRYRIVRGSNWFYCASVQSAGRRGYRGPSSPSMDVGFRLAIQPQ